MKEFLRKLGAYTCYGVVVFLILGILVGERQYLLYVPGWVSLGLIMDGWAD